MRSTPACMGTLRGLRGTSFLAPPRGVLAHGAGGLRGLSRAAYVRRHALLKSVVVLAVGKGSGFGTISRGLPYTPVIQALGSLVPFVGPHVVVGILRRLLQWDSGACRPPDEDASRDAR